MAQPNLETAFGRFIVKSKAGWSQSLGVMPPPFYRMRTLRTGKSSNSPEIADLVSGGSWNLNPESPSPESMVLTTNPLLSINVFYSFPSTGPVLFLFLLV